MKKRLAALAVICVFGMAAAAEAQQPAPPAQNLKISSVAAPQVAAPSPPALAAQTAAPSGTLTLAQAVTLALEHSPDLALARVRYRVAQNYAGVDRADFRPNLFSGSGAAYTNGFPQTPGGAAPAVFEMSYTQSLFDPVKRGTLRADEDLAKNQQLEYENTRNLVTVKAASAYLELAEVRHSLELLASEQSSEQQILDVARERAQAGLELPVAVTQDELALAKIQQRIVQFQSRDEILSQQLRDMTGLPVGQPLEVSTGEQIATGPAPLASDILSAALGHSSLIQEAENQRTARQHLLRGAKQAYWPTIGIVGEYSVLSKFNNYALFFNHFQRNNLNVGVQITIPIFSAKTSANVALAQSQLNEADLEVSHQKQVVRLGTEEKVRALRESDAGKEVARLDLQLAQEQLQDAESKFNQGRETLEDLEQAKLTENEKWLAFLDANLAQEKAHLDLLDATGQLAQVFPEANKP